jgi:hypothetical protein
VQLPGKNLAIEKYGNLMPAMGFSDEHAAIAPEPKFPTQAFIIVLI